MIGSFNTDGLGALVGLGLLGLLAAGVFAFWVWMLIDCATREREGSTKVVWILIILLAGFIGAPLYFIVRFLGRQPRPPYVSRSGLVQPWKRR